MTIHKDTSKSDNLDKQIGDPNSNQNRNILVATSFAIAQ